MAKRKWCWPGDPMIEIERLSGSLLLFKVFEHATGWKEFVLSVEAAQRVGSFLLGLNKKKGA